MKQIDIDFDFNKVNAEAAKWDEAKIKKCNKNDCATRDMMKIDDLIGCKITNIGMIDEKTLELNDKYFGVEGGFVIDYEKNGKEKRVVLGFTELGMWTYWQGMKKTKK